MSLSGIAGENSSELRDFRGFLDAAHLSSATTPPRRIECQTTLFEGRWEAGEDFNSPGAGDGIKVVRQYQTIEYRRGAELDIERRDLTPLENGSFAKVQNWRAISDEKFSLVRQIFGNESQTSTVAIATTNSQELARYGSSPEHGAFLDGCFDVLGGSSIAGLRQADITAIEKGEGESLGQKARHWNVSTSSGGFDFWVLAERPDVLVSMKIGIGAGGVAWGKDLAEIGVAEVIADYKATGLVEKGGHSFATGGVLELTTVNADGSRVIRRFDAKRNSIDVTPDFDGFGAFRSDLPNGTPVVYDSFPGIRYAWENNRLTQVLDTESLQAIDDAVNTVEPPVLTDRMPGARVAKSLQNDLQANDLGQKISVRPIIGVALFACAGAASIGYLIVRRRKGGAGERR